MAHKTDNGNWKVRWRDKAEDIMRARTFERKVDAQKFEAELKLGMRFNVEVRNYTTFAQFSERWLKEYSRVHKSESQQKEDVRLIRDYFLPSFGEKLLRELTKRDLISFQAKLVAEKQLKPKSINNITGVARKIMEDAFDWEMVSGNVWGSVKPLPVPEAAFRFWTAVEAERFLTFCKSRDPALFEYVLFLLNTGLRKGEVEGLLRDSIDIDRKEITVRRTYNSRVPTKLQEHTKSKKIRRVPMNGRVVDILQSKRLLAPNQKVFVFKDLRRFQLMAEKAGVTVINIHDLRHTFASHMVMAGRPLYEVKELLGHSDIRITQRYAHLSPGYLTGATDCLVPRVVPDSLEVLGKLVKV